MKARFFAVFLMLLLAGCSESSISEENTSNVLDDDGDIVQPDSSEVEIEDEEVVEEEKTDVEQAYEELTIEEMLSNAMLGSQAVDEFHSTVTVEKELSYNEYYDKVKGKFETSYSMQHASDEAQQPIRIKYNHSFYGREIGIENEGYISPIEDEYEDEQIYHFYYSNMTERWIGLYYYEDEKFFYLTPAQVLQALFPVYDEAEYNFTDQHEIEVMFTLDPTNEKHATVIRAFTTYKMEENVPYVGGEGWLLDDQPVTVHMLVNVEDHRLDQFIFNLYEKRDEELRDTYFIQNYDYDTPVENIIVPEDVPPQAFAG